MAPSVVARQELVELAHQVYIGSRAKLHDHDSGRRVGHEHVEQPVPLPGDECRALASDVEESTARTGLDGDLSVLHVPIEVSVKSSRP